MVKKRFRTAVVLLLVWSATGCIGHSRNFDYAGMLMEIGLCKGSASCRDYAECVAAVTHKYNLDYLSRECEAR